MIEDFSNYENSNMIPDQSAWQVGEFWMTSCSLNVYEFFESKNIDISLTSNTLKELGYQSYDPNLFSVSSTSELLSNKENYALSSFNGSVTLQELDGRSYPVNINETTIVSNLPFQQSLWDMSPSFQRMKRKVLEKGKGVADLSIIYLARRFAKENRRFFIFTNDNDIIKQSTIEGFLYLRPIKLLKWMTVDKYISRQKAVCVFEKMKKHDLRWIDKKKLRFRDYLS